MSLPGWTKSHGEGVRHRVKMIAQSPKPQTIGGGLRWEAAAISGLLQCYSDLGGAIAVSPSGEMFSLNENTNWQPESLLENDEWYWVGLAKLAALPGFGDLLPALPADSTQCAACAGLGKVIFGSGEVGCGTCFGFGWTADEGMVSALIRATRSKRERV